MAFLENRNFKVQLWPAIKNRLKLFFHIWYKKLHSSFFFSVESPTFLKRLFLPIWNKENKRYWWHFLISFLCSSDQNLHWILNSESMIFSWNFSYCFLSDCLWTNSYAYQHMFVYFYCNWKFLHNMKNICWKKHWFKI